mgnify:CR=1 FL=1
MIVFCSYGIGGQVFLGLLEDANVRESVKCHVADNFQPGREIGFANLLLLLACPSVGLIYKFIQQTIGFDQILWHSVSSVQST